MSNITDLTSASPCVAPLERRCLGQHPKDAVDCLLKNFNATKCTRFLSGRNSCLKMLENKCGGPADLRCMWENRHALEAECTGTDFFRRVESLLTTAMPVSVQDYLSGLPQIQLPFKDCRAADWSLCVEDLLSGLCPSCREILSSREFDCMKEVYGRCGSRDLFQCLWRERNALLDTCNMPQDALDLQMLLGDHGNASALLGCWDHYQSLSIQPGASIAQNAEVILKGLETAPVECRADLQAVSCFVDAMNRCSSSDVACRLHQADYVRMHCPQAPGGQLITAVVDQLPGVRTSVELAICIRAFSRLDCFEADPQKALACLIENHAALPSHCEKFLGQADTCFDDFRRFCNDPAGQLAWVLENRDSVADVCRTTDFFKSLGAGGAILSLGACALDIWRLRCASANPSEVVLCLLRSRSSTQGQCRSLIDGVSQCIEPLQETCRESVSIAQLLWIDANRDSFSDECQNSDFFDRADAFAGAVISGLERYDLLRCRSEIKTLGCLSGSAQQRVNCLRRRAEDPLTIITDNCAGLLRDMMVCAQDVAEKCGTEPELRCLWEHAQTLSPECAGSEYFRAIQADFNEVRLPESLARLPAVPVEGVAWPCEFDLRSLGSVSIDLREPQAVLEQLLERSDSLLAPCQEFLLGRELCMTEVADECGALGDPSELLSSSVSQIIHSAHLCVWKSAHKLSEACLGSAFFRNFTFPRGMVNASDLLGAAASPVESTAPTEASASNEDSGSSLLERDLQADLSSPFNTPGASAVVLWDSAERSQIFYGPCFTFGRNHCSDHDPDNLSEVRSCMEHSHPNGTCGEWFTGLMTCTKDTKILCPSSEEAMLRCMSSKTTFLSSGCRQSLFYQGALAFGVDAQNAAQPQSPAGAGAGAGAGNADRSSSSKYWIWLLIGGTMLVVLVLATICCTRRARLQEGIKLAQLHQVVDQKAVDSEKPDLAQSAEPVKEEP
eukprot:NODE_130_length_3125_cov_3.673927_g120_i0.p1 GENE.NODE_130_length_3125_cov_3.673927_g120_i0~~NODE_130_length_3125_cov_3.673927_g120_i0.p1  ORF type:complete len:1032 (+),score=142.48 NODE_130_length_3125_cov_3.673927_g120_i0:223-3096(+)